MYDSTIRQNRPLHFHLYVTLFIHIIHVNKKHWKKYEIRRMRMILALAVFSFDSSLIHVNICSVKIEIWRRTRETKKAVIKPNECGPICRQQQKKTSYNNNIRRIEVNLRKWNIHSSLSIYIYNNKKTPNAQSLWKLPTTQKVTEGLPRFAVSTVSFFFFIIHFIPGVKKCT